MINSAVRRFFHTVCIASAVFIGLLVVGCTVLENSPVTARLTVSYATLKVIENAPTEQQQARRERIHDIASDAKTIVSGEAVTIALLEAAIRERIDTSKLSPADAFLANALIETVMQELLTRVGTGMLDQTQVIAVNTVLDWVIEATAV